jgi:cell division protease FtsH
VHLRGQLGTLLAGRTAEKLLLVSVSSGADDDIRRATEIARATISRWGMDPDIGPVDLRQSVEHPFLGQQMAQPRSFADETAARVDRAVMDLLHAAEAEAGRMIETHRDAGERLVARLEAEYTLDLSGIKGCLDATPAVIPFRNYRTKRTHQTVPESSK